MMALTKTLVMRSLLEEYAAALVDCSKCLMQMLEYLHPSFCHCGIRYSQEWWIDYQGMWNVESIFASLIKIM